jgi:iron complex transport system substrate-binding protein
MNVRKAAQTSLVSLLFVSLLIWPSFAGFPVKVSDDRGKEITITKKPERIVIAGAALYAEILVDLGAASRVVGITDSADNPPEFARVEKLGNVFAPNIEKIIALKPDLVLGAFGKPRDALEAAGLIVLTTPFISSSIDVFKSIRTIGLAMDGETLKSDTLVGRFSEAIVSDEARVLERAKPTVAILYPSPEAPPFAAGSSTPENEIVLRAGGQNIFTDFTQYKQVNFEELVKRNPDLILTDPSQVSLITGHRLLKETKAAKNGKVFGVKASSWTSSRIAQTLREVAKLLHPDAFKEK